MVTPRRRRPFVSRAFRLAVATSLLGCVVSCGMRCNRTASAVPRPIVHHAHPAARELRASIDDVTSSRVAVGWGRVEGATTVRVYLSPEPAAVRGQRPASAVLVATLPGSATLYDLEDLAAGCDVFVRVEADAPAGAQSQDLHARTLGGPRAALDTALREVHAVAPDVLMLVLDGGDGARWQAGPWSIARADGRAITVGRVSRHSLPVAAPSYSVGFAGAHDDAVVETDHRIYLALGAPLGAHEVLRVRGPSGLHFTVPFSDRYTETPVVQLNQVGYNPRATRRYAYVSAWLGDGGPLALGRFPAAAEVLVEPADPLELRARAVASPAITPRAVHDADAGVDVREIDLAGVPADEQARYRVRIPGIGVSWPTAVSERAAFKSFYTLARGLFFNRWGGDLRATLSPWPRAIDHRQVFTGEQADFTEFFPENQPHTGARSLAGGYHDAGDFDQRPMHTVVAQLLLRAYELDPAAFADGQLTLPESGNHIPDLLDEALWGINTWEQLQEPDGGVRQGVESWRHPDGYYHASDDPLPYFTYAREPNVTARAAGLFAQAARLLGALDAPRAARLRARAERAWRYATSHNAGSAATLYAAGELYELTRDAAYARAFEAAWTAMGPYGAFSNMATSHLNLRDYATGERAMPDFLQGYLHAGTPTEVIATTTARWLTQSADDAVERTLVLHAHRNPRAASLPLDWGHATATVRDLDAVIARMQLGGLAPDVRQRYFDALSLAADYLLGGNPNGLVYVTGLGSRHPEEPLHLDSLTFLREGRGAMAGLAVYGPTDDVPGTPWTGAARAAFHPAMGDHPPALRYADLRTMVANNEFSVWETQAPDVELFAVLLGHGQMPPPAWLPGGSDARATLP